MSNYTINFTNLAGTLTTFVPDVGFSYTDKLNAVNEAEFSFVGLGTTMRSSLQEGGTVAIYRNGTLIYSGIIVLKDNLDGGGVKISTVGREQILDEEYGAYAGSPYSATASATIAAAIIGESGTFSAGTVDAGADVDFRIPTTLSLWDALQKLTTLVSQDVGIDYVNTKVDVLDHKGSTTSVARLTDGKDIANMRKSTGRPQANYVIVKGKGDGTNQISSTSAHGQDLTSQGTYGVIKKIITDRNCISTAQAEILADAEVNIMSEPVKIYSFDVIDLNLAVVAGDVLTIDSPDKDMSSEAVRVTKVVRGMRGDKEFLRLEVSNAEYSGLVRSRNEVINGIARAQRVDNTAMQGATNELAYGNAKNANNSIPLSIEFVVPDSMQDEAGNMRVNSLLVSYDVDKFKSDAGGASFDGTDPQVQNSSANTQPSVESTSGSTSPDVSGTTATSSGLGAFLKGGSIVASTSLPTDWASFVSSIDMGTTATGFVFIYLTFDIDDTYAPYYFRVKRHDASTYWPSSAGITVDPGADITLPLIFIIGDDVGGYDLDLQIKVSASTADTANFSVAYYVMGKHSHGDGGGLSADSHYHGDGDYYAQNHHHGDGDYDINATDLDNISITDEVGEGASVNATQVSLYLDFWNTGTSAWVNKTSVLNTGKTLDTNVDISSSGTYPDVPGRWRVRILTNSASGDFVQGIVKIKGAVDS
jgi:hypothetical protein